MKAKADIEIGFRMANECIRLFGSPSAAGRAMRCDRKNIHAWRNGYTPSALFLARLQFLGGDALYVLTGKRAREGGSR